MDQEWQRSVFNCTGKNPQQEFCGNVDTGIDNVDLSSMIGEFMQNEQYPYNLNFNDNLTELSPEETEQFLEDAFSLTSSKSPLSEDLTESSLSLQSSPSAPSNDEDMLYMSYLAQDIKQEELSPGPSSIDFKSNLENVTSRSALAMPVNGANSMPVFLQQTGSTASPPQDISSLLQQSVDSSIVQCNESLNITTNSLGRNQTNALNEQLSVSQLKNTVSKKTGENLPTDHLLKLLQKNNDKEISIMEPDCGQVNSRKRANKQRKQKVEPRGSNKVKLVSSKSDESQDVFAGSKDSVKAEVLPPSSSLAVSQVVMIPQVVFTNGTGDNSTSQPLTAYIAASSKQVMTTVPIKIVSSNSVDVEKIPITPIGKKSSNPSLKRKNEKMGRKTNHNEVEKRYRESITTSLEDLKELVFGSETKSTKAGILRKAMDHIKYLRKINQRLKQENMRLKMAQKQTSLVDLVQNHANHNLQQHPIEDFDGPISSEDEDMELMEEEMEAQKSEQSSAAVSPSSVESVQANGTFSLMSKQRFFLSMFMFAFMFLGPGKLLFGASDGPSPDYASSHAGGRTILSYKSDAEDDGSKSYSGMIVNAVLYLLFFAWLLIKGEPRYSRDSKNIASFNTYMSKADAEMMKGDIQGARSSIERGLQVIGRPLSSSKIDLIPSLIWHGLCHILYQIGFLSPLKNLGWLILPKRLSMSEAKSRYHLSCASASQAYAKLLQCAIVDKANPVGKLISAKLTVAAINMAENAEDAMTSEDVMKIYFNAAIILHMKFGRFAAIFKRYLMSRGKWLLAYRDDDIPDSMMWALHPVGYQYLLSASWASYRNDRDDGAVKDPLEQVQEAFFIAQIETTLRQIVAPTSNDLSIQESERCLSLLKQCSRDDDEVLIWWHDLLRTVFYIGVGMRQKAKRSWESINDDVEDLTPYASDLYDLVDCYFDAKDGTEGSEIEARLSMIEDNVAKNFIFDEGRTRHDTFFQLLTATCADMALNVRIACWEASVSRTMTVDQLERFEQSIGILKDLSHHHASLLNKVNYFSEVVRVMAGTNPVGLTKDLLRSRHQQMSRGLCDMKESLQNKEFQKTKAMIFVLKHLPSIVARCYPKSCVPYLQSAGLALEKSGLKEMTEDCKKILATLKTI